MLKQFKYATKDILSVAGVGILIPAVANIVIRLISVIIPNNKIWSIIAVTLSLFLACFACVMVILSSIKVIGRLFSAPQAYLEYLTPVPRWKILLATLVPQIIIYLSTFAIAVGGMMLQATAVVVGETNTVSTNVPKLLGAVAYSVLQCSVAILLLSFVFAVYRSLSTRLPFRKGIATLIGIAVLYLRQLSGLLLSPIIPFDRDGIFFHTNINVGMNLPFIGYMILIAVTAVILFIATAHLMERKVNL